MGAAENKEIIRKMGEAKSLDAMLGAMADDIRWTLIGNTKFSGTFNGKKELRRVCIEGPVFDLQEACGW